MQNYFRILPIVKEEKTLKLSKKQIICILGEDLKKSKPFEYIKAVFQ
jgi:hypothetical protein